MALRKEKKMAIATRCQTPDACYTIEIHESEISVKVETRGRLDLSESEAKLLEANIHNVLELVLRPYV